MPVTDVTAEAQRVLTVCNACRYCEGYCAVFPAIEACSELRAANLHYLANLCHNCGECLYACQFAPPHPFGINVPKVLAQVRLRSYQTYCWPPVLSTAFARHSVLASLLLSIVMTAVIFALSKLTGAAGSSGQVANAQFYDVLPHGAMVVLFGSVFLCVAVILDVTAVRFWRAISAGAPATGRRGALRAALLDISALTYLHHHGRDCTYSAAEAPAPSRRWFHHFIYYGLILCFASTVVAAIYHSGFGWSAPYAYTSVPVVLGVFGGIGLVTGSIGVAWLWRRRDQATIDAAQAQPDAGFLMLLFLSALTGLVLLVLRQTPAMATLLIVHLGVVLALFVTLPYGKFVHGIYRAAALLRFHRLHHE